MKIFKRLLASLLVAVVLLTAAPLSGFVGLEMPKWNLFDFSVKTKALSEGDFTYSISNGKVKIIGCNIPSNGKVIIPSTLGGYAVTSIGDGVFADAMMLRSVTIPEGVLSIGDRAFEDCTSLSQIIVPDSVTSIGKDAFYGCTRLASLTIGSGVKNIGTNAFGSCSSLSSMNYEGDIASWCGISFESYSANPMSSAANFYINNIIQKEIVIPDTVVEIKDYAFYNFKNITSITIGSGVVHIGCFVFQKCKSLTSITIGKRVRSIGACAFSGCTQLERVYYAGDISSWCNITYDDVDGIYDGVLSTPMCYAEEIYINNILQKEIVIPDTVVEIKDYAFYNFRDMSSITIPEGVESIGGYAFYGCTSLNQVTIPDSVTSIGRSAFCGCTSLSQITISDSVSYIGSSAFSGCTSLESVDLPEGLSSVNYYLFEECNSLTSVSIPDSVTEIRKEAFYNCRSLKSIVIPDNVKYIDEWVFYNCNSLSSVTIGKNVTFIGCDAFMYCTSLASITIPDSVTEIRKEAFYSCTGLKELVMPISTKIYGNTFAYCKNVKRVILTKGTGEAQNYGHVAGSGDNEDTYIGYTPWYRGGCSEIIIEDGVTYIGKQTFENNTSLTTITIPLSVILIKNKAFSGCNNIKTVYYEGTQEEWNEIVFYEGNESLKNANVIFETDSHKHVYGLTAATESTCTKTGTKTYECRCGDTYTETVPVKSHKWSGWVVSREPTQTTVGMKTRTCTVCKVAIENVEIPAYGKVSNVSIDNISMNYKDSTTITPNIIVDAGVGYTVTYSSSDYSVASVDEYGNVYASGKGSATISVTVTDQYGNTVNDTCDVNVNYSFGQWLIIIFLFGWIWY